MEFPARRVALLLVSCALYTPQALLGQTVAGPIINPSNGHEYYLVGPAYWTDAQARATVLGGSLAAINDEAENRWVLETFGNYGGISRTLMIGLTDEGQEGQWRWTNGDPVTYQNWAGDEPNNGGGIFRHENVASMYGHGDPRAGLWNDMLGTLAEQQYWGVIEIRHQQPELSIRVSEIELSWFAENGTSYQIQYQSALTTNLWMNLGAPIPGTGSTAHASDRVPAEEPRRLYRITVSP